MNLSFFRILLICYLCFYGWAFAEETDQFTLPPIALFDLGPEASERVHALLETIIKQTNSEIQVLIPKAKQSKQAARQLAKRKNYRYLASLFYKKTGAGFPSWLRNLPKQSQPLQYREIWPWKTVYWLAFSQCPLSLISLTPTINMFDHYFGTDKLGHIFLQGYAYYLIYNFCIDHGKSPAEAHEIMVAYGQISEQTYLGTLVNGVYSNADLAANYAGWKFYTNFTQGISLGDTHLPPLLEWHQDHWEFAPFVRKETLLAPYISDTFNEALNPSRYTFSRSQIRKQIKKRCAEWIDRRGITKEYIEAKLEESKSWHGESYGFWLPKKNAVSLRDCF